MTTKILALPLILLAVGCRDRYEGQAGAASTPSPTATPYTTASPYTSPATGVTAVVVAVDPAGRTITLREAEVPGGTTSASGSQGQRYNVSSGAAPSLGNVRVGERVTVTCEESAGTMGTGTGTGSLARCGTITMIEKAAGTR
jgi:hypothetical protein